MVLPNQLTVLRIILTPIFYFLFISDDSLLKQISVVVFLIAAITDWYDGWLARKFNYITDWGKFLDPLADKILIGSMVFIIVLRYIDFWPAIIIIALESLIILVAFIRKEKGGEIQANIWGKIKMGLEVVCVTILLLAVIFKWATFLPIASGTLYLAIAFAIVSLLSYGI